MSGSCPLCVCSATTLYSQDKRRQYFQCSRCDLVFVARSALISPEQEKEVYDLHENDLDDSGYKAFLSRAAEPLLSELKQPSKGLDFGCGPAPALANMLAQAGHNMSLYDIFYYPDEQVLNHRYDFITCTEVIEHLAEPQKVWTQLLNLLQPSGTLVVMTKLVISPERFQNWHYKNDITHINFFSRKTFDFLALQYDLSVTYIGNDVMLFKKPAMV